MFNLCGSDADTVFHIMNPADIQLQVADLEPQVCPGETIQVNTTVNLDFYDLDVVITPAADIDWNPLTETLVVGAGVPSGDYVEEFVGVSGTLEGMEQLPDGIFLPPIGFNCAEEEFGRRIGNTYNDRRLIPGRCAHLTEPFLCTFMMILESMK